MKGFVISYPGCIMAEVEPTIALLEKRCTLKIIDMNSLSLATEADFVIVPGGSCQEAVFHTPLHTLLQCVSEKSGLLAGICNGAVVFASAGVLKNKKCTHTAHPKYASLPRFQKLLDFAEQAFAGSTYIDEDVVIDDNIITAKPQAALEFAQAISTKLFPNK